MAKPTGKNRGAAAPATKAPTQPVAQVLKPNGREAQPNFEIMKSSELVEVVKTMYAAWENAAKSFNSRTKELYLPLAELELRFLKQPGKRTDLDDLDFGAMGWHEYLRSVGVNPGSFRMWKSRLEAKSQLLLEVTEDVVDVLNYDLKNAKPEGDQNREEATQELLNKEREAEVKTPTHEAPTDSNTMLSDFTQQMKDKVQESEVLTPASDAVKTLLLGDPGYVSADGLTTEERTAKADAELKATMRANALNQAKHFVGEYVWLVTNKTQWIMVLAYTRSEAWDKAELILVTKPLAIHNMLVNTIDRGMAIVLTQGVMEGLLKSLPLKTLGGGSLVDAIESLKTAADNDTSSSNEEEASSTESAA